MEEIQKSLLITQKKFSVEREQTNLLKENSSKLLQEIETLKEEKTQLQLKRNKFIVDS